MSINLAVTIKFSGQEPLPLFADFLAFSGYSSSAPLILLTIAAAIGGLVRGFTGFGFAMVFVPIATIIVGPAKAAALIWLIDIPFAWPLAAAGFRRVAWREVMPLILGAILFVPFGVWLLTTLDPVTARWATAMSILAGVIALASGWRYRGAPGASLSLGVGGLSGTASGLAQLGGMPIAIFWLAAQQNNARQTRDNLNGFFAILPIFTGLAYWWTGVLTWTSIRQALPLLLPYGLALMVGSLLFSQASELLFRRIAYAVIFLAAVTAMPVIDQIFAR